MTSRSVHIRPACLEDLETINQLIKVAVMTWDLPDRVKRLSLSSYQYTQQDLKHLEMVVAENDNHHVLGVAAWEEADSKDIPAEQRALLLHGIYVDPLYHHQGIGGQLFLHAEQAARQQHFDGLLVKAQTGAEGFFLSQGMGRVEVEDAGRDYANRFWKQVQPPAQ